MEYNVVVKSRQLNGTLKGVYEEVVYQVFAKTAEDAMESVVARKGVSKKDIKAVQSKGSY
ncbi:MAG: hypothetical protein WC175_04120 [Candidatus Dojkabacteria bacterium]